MVTVEHVHYEIHDEVSKNDKVHNSFIKNVIIYALEENLKLLKSSDEKAKNCPFSDP